MNDYQHEYCHTALSSLALKKRRKYIQSMHSWFQIHANWWDTREFEKQCALNEQACDEIEWTISMLKTHVELFLSSSDFFTTPRSFFYENTYQDFKVFCEAAQEEWQDYEDFHKKYYWKSREDIV